MAANTYHAPYKMLGGAGHVIALLVPLALAILLFGVILIRSAIQRRAVPKLEAIVVGAVVNFFDTLGIGSLRRRPPAKVPQARARPIDPADDAGRADPAVDGGIDHLPDPARRAGRPGAAGGMRHCLADGRPSRCATRCENPGVDSAAGRGDRAAACRRRLRHDQPSPVSGGGTASSLPPLLMIVAIAANFAFGVLLNFGVGNFAPSLVMFSLMGMDPRLAFPIMAAGAAMTGAGASIRHLQIGQIDLRIVLGLAIGGIPAVLVAAFLVKTMPLELLRWLVIVVVLYAAAVMLRAAMHGRREHQDEGATAPVAG